MYYMPEVVVTVYGLSTEGYSIARKLVAKNIKVFVIDEMSSSAMLLPPDIAKSYADVTELREDEPLLSLCPTKDAISMAQYLFFTPMIRKRSDEARDEAQSRLKSISASLSPGSTIVYSFPTGFGENDDCINLLEHVTGLEVGKTLSYYYYPLLRHKQSEIIGSLGQNDEAIAELLSDGYEKKQFVTIPMAEHVYAMEIVSKLTKMVSVLEICNIAKKNGIGEEFLNRAREFYLDDIADILYEMHAFKASIDGAIPLYYIINESLKSINNYIKRVVYVLRNTIKESKVRSNKTNLILLWNMDRSEMRGEKIVLYQDVIAKMEGYVGSIGTSEEIGQEALRIGETTFILACTKQDFEMAVRAKTDHQIIIKANSLLDVIR